MNARALLLAAVVIGVGGEAAAAEGELTRVPVLEPNVAFWKKVYIEWSLNDIVLHDERDLSTVYRVLKVAARGEKSKDGLMRAEAISRGRSELEAALKSLAKKSPKTDAALRGVEKEVFNNLKNVTRADKYTRLQTIRVQNGLRERFLQGWSSSGLYEPFILAELRRSGLPEELIGVAFVESLFYVGAKSKVGAAGVWQFMSYTGKEYMQLNAVVDERYDPILATEAACKYLRQAKKELGTWPLAVTSYNYGRGGAKGLVAGAGTKDFGTILAVSKNKRFGFAARNYYASFLAVHDILKARDTLLKGFSRKAPWSFDVIRTPFPLYTTQLTATGEVDAAHFDVLNPALMNEARDGIIPLPHGISLRVPKGKATKILDKLASLPVKERTRAARATKTVHASTGKQSISDVAKKYGLSADVLSAATGLDKADVPAKGQRIAIPHASMRYSLLPEARSMVVPPLPAQEKILLADAAQVPDEPAPVAERPTAVDAKPKVDKKAKGVVKISFIRTEPLATMPGVDVIAGVASPSLPDVDVIAGDPADHAPRDAPSAPTVAASAS
jgi:membrane-bound lytic murein transglycosylase D